MDQPTEAEWAELDAKPDDDEDDGPTTGPGMYIVYQRRPWSGDRREKVVVFRYAVFADSPEHACSSLEESYHHNDGSSYSSHRCNGAFMIGCYTDDPTDEERAAGEKRKAERADPMEVILESGGSRTGQLEIDTGERIYMVKWSRPFSEGSHRVDQIRIQDGDGRPGRRVPATSKRYIALESFALRHLAAEDE